VGPATSWAVSMVEAVSEPQSHESLCCISGASCTAEAGLGAPQMVVMSDTDDPFVPLPDDLLVNLRESRAVFEGLLDAIPATFAANSQVRGRLVHSTFFGDVHHYAAGPANS
jgi:hypothetical protein